METVSLESPELVKKSRKYRCLRCDTLKPKEEFVKDKRRQTGIFPWCKQCHCEYQKIYREANPETIRERKRKYNEANREAIRNRKREREGLLPIVISDRFCPFCKGAVIGRLSKIFCSPKCNDKFERLDMYGLTPEEFEKLTASGKCPLCDCKVIKWQIDHNHETGETMGSVCSRCNQYLLAGSKHNLEIAKRLVEFLTCSPVTKLCGEKRYSAPPRTSNWHRIWLWTGQT